MALYSLIKVGLSILLQAKNMSFVINFIFIVTYMVRYAKK